MAPGFRCDGERRENLRNIGGRGGGTHSLVDRRAEPGGLIAGTLELLGRVRSKRSEARTRRRGKTLSMQGYARGPSAYLLVVGLPLGCHAGKPAPPEGATGGASVRSTLPRAESTPPYASIPPPPSHCDERAERMRVGAVERKVTLLVVQEGHGLRRREGL